MVLLAKTVWAVIVHPAALWRAVIGHVHEYWREYALVVLLGAYFAAVVVPLSIYKDEARGQFPPRDSNIQDFAELLSIGLQALMVVTIGFHSNIGQFVLAPIKWFRDVLRLRNYRKDAVGPLSPERFLEDLSGWHHDGFRPRFVALVRRENLLAPSMSSVEMLKSLALVLEQRADFGVASRVVADWYRSYRILNAWRFDRWATEALDELCLLENQLNEQVRRSAVSSSRESRQAGSALT
jgi:hypothetical protein